MAEEDISGEIRKKLEAVDTILFDLDGTLVDTVDLIRQSFRFSTRQVLGRTFSDETVLKDIGIPLRFQMEALSKVKAGELIKTYQRFYNRSHDRLIKKYPHVSSLVGELKKKGYKLGIVTSKRRQSSQRNLKVCGLEGYFEVMVAFEDVTEYKPEPAPVLEALRQIDSSPLGTLLVGDSPYDIESGKGAGVLTAAALWGPYDLDRLLESGPHILLRDIRELLQILE